MILVDGSSCLHRCLNTPLAEATDSSGRSVGGVSGFLASIGSTVNKLRQQHLIIVAWDVGIPVHRQQLFPSYKSHNRSIAGLGIPGNFERQLLSRNGDKLPTNFREKYLIARRILSMNLLPFMGCLSIQVPNCEADDIIAYICDKITDEEIVILSSDMDLVQLLNSDRSFQDVRSNSRKTLTVDDLIHTYTLVPDRWREHWLMARAIAGDVSDDIPGIPGIGLLTALEYARQIVTKIEKIPLPDRLFRLERVHGGRMAAYEALRFGASVVERNLKLMDLRYPIENNLPMLRDIKAQIAGASILEPDPYRVESELHVMGLDKSKIHAGSITESNYPFDARDYITRLV